MTSGWLTNLPLSGWNFPGMNRDQSWFCCCCCHFCCKENTCLDALFLFWRSETQNQAARTGELCQPAQQTVLQGRSTMTVWWHLSCPLGQSSHPLTEMEQSYIPPLLYITCASRLQEWCTAPTTTTPSLQHYICYIDKWASYTKLQPHALEWFHLPPSLLWLKGK